MINSAEKIARTAKKTRTKPFHVLAVDDDVFLLSAVRKSLELANYRVTVCTNVQDANFKLKLTEPDLVLLDIIMPEVNGLEFLKALHVGYDKPRAPVMIMSALTKQQIFEMGYSLGLASSHYLAKPFDVNQLPSIIENVLMQR